MFEFKFDCPNCGSHIRTTDDWIGRPFNCPVCKTHVIIPPPQDTPVKATRVSPPVAKQQPITRAPVPRSVSEAPPEKPINPGPDELPETVAYSATAQSQPQPPSDVYKQAVESGRAPSDLNNNAAVVPPHPEQLKARKKSAHRPGRRCNRALSRTRRCAQAVGQTGNPACTQPTRHRFDEGSGCSLTISRRKRSGNRSFGDLLHDPANNALDGGHRADCVPMTPIQLICHVSHSIFADSNTRGARIACGMKRGYNKDSKSNSDG